MGYGLLIDEIASIKPDRAMFLNSILQEREIDLGTGTVMLHDDCRVIGTCNEGEEYVGSIGLDPSTTDRFVPMYLDYADEKTEVYGTTRAWSQLGSALSGVIAAAIVIFSESYAWIFWASIVPYCMGLWNFVCYPKYLDACPLDKPTIGTAVQHLVSTCRDCVGNVRLRSLLLESVACEGLFHTSKDYVQPLVKQWVILLPLAAAMSGDQRTAILMGCVTFVLAVVSGIGSKQAHRFATACRGEERAALVGWVAMLALYGLLVPTLHWRDLYPIAIAGFVLLHLVENLWRPVQLSRYDAFAGGAKGATVLSVESQGKSLAMFLLAPLVGFLVDHHGLGMVGVVGVAVVGLRLLVRVVRGTR